MSESMQTQVDYYRDLIKEIPCTVSRVTSDLKYLDVNTELSEYLGMDASKFEGQEVGFMNHKNPLRVFLQEFFSKEETMDDTVEIAVYQGHIPRYFLIKAKKTPCKTEAYLIGVDITAQKIVRDNKMKKDLKNVEGQTVRTLLHDMTNPLTCISHAAKRISSDYKRDPDKYSDVKEMVEILDKSTKTLVKHVRLLREEIKKNG